MNRLLAACFIGVLGSLGTGCGVTGVGDPCIPEDEFVSNSGQAVLEDLVIDVNSVQCETRVCLRHYFSGKVSCPFGNGAKSGQTGKCIAPAGAPRGVFTLEGKPLNAGGELCCPNVGDVEQQPINKPVDAQCSGRRAQDSVYCSCRCDVPNDPEIDKSQVNLCKCPSGYACVELCSATKGSCSIVPKGKWGSYCVKEGPAGAGFDPDRASATCGARIKP